MKIIYLIVVVSFFCQPIFASTENFSCHGVALDGTQYDAKVHLVFPAGTAGSNVQLWVNQKESIIGCVTHVIDHSLPEGARYPLATCDDGIENGYYLYVPENEFPGVHFLAIARKIFSGPISNHLISLNCE